MYELLEKFADFKAEVRAFCDDKIAHFAVEVDEKQIFKKEVQELVNSKGWWGCIIPKEYGGLGLSSTEYTIVVEEVSRVARIQHGPADLPDLVSGPPDALDGRRDRQRALHEDDLVERADVDAHLERVGRDDRP